MIIKNTVVLIPCAGKGTRAKLPYPKSLHKVNDKVILHRIMDSFKKFNLEFKIVINPKNIVKFKKNNIQYTHLIEYLFQRNALGMGDAVLKICNSKNYSKIDHIILIWGDIPFIRVKTINSMLKFHFKERNDFTFVTGKSKNPYTYVVRNTKHNIVKVLEMKNKTKSINIGERDIGLFIFKKKLTIDGLKYLKQKNNKKKEVSFLSIVELLVKKKYKVKALKIANNKEMKSLNYLKDLN